MKSPTALTVDEQHHIESGAWFSRLSQELRDPEHFDQLRDLITEDDLSFIPCGPDVETHVASIRQFVEAGFTHVHVTQIGPDQEGFFRFFERELRPALEGVVAAAA